MITPPMILPAYEIIVLANAVFSKYSSMSYTIIGIITIPTMRNTTPIPVVFFFESTTLS